jgi:hypothetical protein
VIKEDQMFRNFKILMVMMLVFVLVGSSYAFAAANTIELSNAGQGEKMVSGYGITDLKYNLKLGDPTSVDTITFIVTPDEGGENRVAAKSVYIEADKDALAANLWIKCGLVVDGTDPLIMHATCDYRNSINLKMVDVDTTNIVASSTDGTGPLVP